MSWILAGRLRRFANGPLLACCLALWGAASGEWTVSALPADELREVKLDALTLKVPAAWKQQQPTSNLRLGQFAIPAAEGDPEPAELAIFNFGIGGGIKANVDRWVGQFEADGRKTKASQGKCPQGEYVLVDISGTYKKPIGPPVQQRTQPAPGYRMLGLILAVEKKGHYFLKLTGPDKTVSAATAALRAAFGGQETDEKPYEPTPAE